jgi:septal ring factor EnvC (AmiA/AmiB activator)
MVNEARDESILARLERGFREQQTSFMNTRDEVNSLKSAYGVIQRDIMSLANSVEKLVARFEDSHKTNWPLLALLAGLLPIFIGGGAFMLSSYTSSAVAPVHTEIVSVTTSLRALADQVKEIAAIQNDRTGKLSNLAVEATTNQNIITRMVDRQRVIEDAVQKSAAADENSRTDRKQLNERMSKIEDLLRTEITERRTNQAETRVQLAEIEQQFHSVSNLDNLRAAQQERLNAMMWEKAFPGTRYPNGTFFPTSIFQGPGGSPPINPGGSSP